MDGQVQAMDRENQRLRGWLMYAIERTDDVWLRLYLLKALEKGNFHVAPDGNGGVDR